MKKLGLKNRILSKIVIFTVITMVCLWLLPVGFISAEGSALPVITLNGDSTVDVVVNTAYEEAGATASVTVVNEDLSESAIDLTGSIVIAGADAIDTTVVGGSFAVTYDVSDASGNAAVQVIRTVNVVEAPPVEDPPVEDPIVEELILGVTGQESSELTDQTTPSITINKHIDSSSLRGITFTFTLSSPDQTGKTATITIGSGDNGSATVTGLVYGTWTITEAAGDFICDNSTHEVTLSSTNKSGTVSFVNDKIPGTGSITINKHIDSSSLRGIPFTFTLSSPNQTDRTATITIGSGDNGSTTVIGLPYGIWTVTEAAGDFICDNSTHEATLNSDNNSKTVSFENDRIPGTGSIKIEKTIKDNSLKGIPFTFTLSSPNQTDRTATITIGSGDNGSTTVIGLPYGTWTVKEAAGDFICDNSTHEETLNSDHKDKTVSFENRKFPSCPVEIIKTVDGAPATTGSFSFTVTESAGDKVGSAGFIPKNFTLSGPYKITFDAKCGVEYTITEDGPPSGFAFGGVDSNIVDAKYSGQSVTFTVKCACDDEENGSSINNNSVEKPIVPAGTITFNNNTSKTITGSALLRLVKTSSATGLPLAGAVYSLYVGSTLIYDLLPTLADGSTLVSLPWLNTVYTVREKTAPAGYALDPTSYTVTAGADAVTIGLNVQDSPLVGGGGTVTVAAITEGIQVLAFTGIDPVIPISGASVFAGGLAMLLVSLRKKFRNKK